MGKDKKRVQRRLELIVDGKVVRAVHLTEKRSEQVYDMMLEWAGEYVVEGLE